MICVEVMSYEARSEEKKFNCLIAWLMEIGDLAMALFFVVGLMLNESREV